MTDNQMPWARASDATQTMPSGTPPQAASPTGQDIPWNPGTQPAPAAGFGTPAPNPVPASPQAPSPHPSPDPGVQPPTASAPPGLPSPEETARQFAAPNEEPDFGGGRKGYDKAKVDEFVSQAKAVINALLNRPEVGAPQAGSSADLEAATYKIRELTGELNATKESLQNAVSRAASAEAAELQHRTQMENSESARAGAEGQRNADAARSYDVQADLIKERESVTQLTEARDQALNQAAHSQATIEQLNRQVGEVTASLAIAEEQVSELKAKTTQAGESTQMLQMAQEVSDRMKADAQSEANTTIQAAHDQVSSIQAESRKGLDATKSYRERCARELGIISQRLDDLARTTSDLGANVSNLPNSEGFDAGDPFPGPQEPASDVGPAIHETNLDSVKGPTSDPTSDVTAVESTWG